MKLLINYDHGNFKHGETISLPLAEAKELIRQGVAAAINPEEEFSETTEPAQLPAEVKEVKTKKKGHGSK